MISYAIGALITYIKFLFIGINIFSHLSFIEIVSLSFPAFSYIIIATFLSFHFFKIVRDIYNSFIELNTKTSKFCYCIFYVFLSLTYALFIIKISEKIKYKVDLFVGLQFLIVFLLYSVFYLFIGIGKKGVPYHYVSFTIFYMLFGVIVAFFYMFPLQLENNCTVRVDNFTYRKHILFENSGYFFFYDSDKKETLILNKEKISAISCFLR